MKRKLSLASAISLLLAWSMPAFAASHSGSVKLFGTAISLITLALLAPVLVVALIAFTLLVASYFPEKTAHRASIARRRAVASLLVGIVLSLLLVGLGIALVSTNSGASVLGLILLLAWLIIAIFGWTASAYCSGEEVLALFGRHEAKDAQKVSWGAGTLSLSALVFPVGTLILLYALLVGIGAVILARGKQAVPPEADVSLETPSGLD